MIPGPIESLRANDTVRVDGADVLIACTPYLAVSRPLVASFGPLRLAMNTAEAIALGNALIRMAHHHTAALAEYKASRAAGGES